MTQGVRGMHVVLPEDGHRVQAIEDVVRSVLRGFSYEHVTLPVLEYTELFSRGVGEATDIVEKEMYTLEDRDGASIALRPEGTAGCVRALNDAGLLYNQTQRVWYTGQMFRYERPQMGRYRQFTQFGAEAFGMHGPDVDAELIQICATVWKRLQVDTQVQLELNTLGSRDSRLAHREALVEFLTPLADELDEDSQRRLQSNPLRILDSKVARTQELLQGAPLLGDYVDADSRSHFEQLCVLLESLGIPFTLNPSLVRGLDYYTHTVFEWTTALIGAQSTICGGGRYDGLVETLGGRPTPAAGFGMGVDRVALLHQAVNQEWRSQSADVYLCVQNQALTAFAQQTAARLRDGLPQLAIRVHHGGGKLKAQFKRADVSGARWAVVIGEAEAQENRMALRSLREGGEQLVLDVDEVINHLTVEGG